MFSLFIDFINECAVWTYLYDIHNEISRERITLQQYVELLGEEWVEEVYTKSMSLQGHNTWS